MNLKSLLLSVKSSISLVIAMAAKKEAVSKVETAYCCY